MTTHKECKYYLAVDVFKGMCKRDKNKITADEFSCESFKNIEKCKHCTNYTSETEFIGKCEKQSLAYAEMTAVTCEKFNWK